jgi:nuclear pore complex protein Nup155
MSYGLQTPQRQLPGAFLVTPATNRQLTTPFVRANSYGNRESVSHQNPPPPAFGSVPKPAEPAPSQPAPSQPQNESLKPIQRAARTVNDTLLHESRYPELDSYVGRECLL